MLIRNHSFESPTVFFSPLFYTICSKRNIVLVSDIISWWWSKCEQRARYFEDCFGKEKRRKTEQGLKKGGRVWVFGGVGTLEISIWNRQRGERGIGMRHTFHRPLWSAFHFYLYLPPLPSQPRFLYIYIPSFCGSTVHTQGAENDRERHRGRGGAGWERDGRIVAFSTRYFTTFCFQSEGRRCRGITRHRALFDFYGVKSWWSVHEIALSADLFFFFPFHPLPPSSFLRRLYAILFRNWDASLGKWSFFDLFFIQLYLSSTTRKSLESLNSWLKVESKQKFSNSNIGYISLERRIKFS